MFTSDPVFKVFHGSQELGSVDQITFLRHREEEPAVLSMGGRSWLVTLLDWERREAFVVPAESKGKSQWQGGRIGMSWRFARAVHSLLAGKSESDRWTSRTRSALTSLREQYGFLRPEADVAVTDRERDEVRWFTFAGGLVNTALTRRGHPASLSRNPSALTIHLAWSEARLVRTISSKSNANFNKGKKRRSVTIGTRRSDYSDRDSQSRRGEDSSFDVKWCPSPDRETIGAIRGAIYQAAHRLEHRSPGCIFVSYASPDLRIAEYIVKQLQDKGLLVWFDKQQLQPGQDWEAEFSEAVERTCGVFLSLISDTSAQRLTDYNILERNLASKRRNHFAENEVFYIPLRIDDGDPPVPANEPRGIRKIHAVRKSGGHLDDGFIEYLRKLQLEYIKRYGWRVRTCLKSPDVSIHAEHE